MYHRSRTWMKGRKSSVFLTSSYTLWTYWKALDFTQKKPTNLSHLVGKNSRFIFSLLNLSKDEDKAWLNNPALSWALSTNLKLYLILLANYIWSTTILNRQRSLYQSLLILFTMERTDRISSWPFKVLGDQFRELQKVKQVGSCKKYWTLTKHDFHYERFHREKENKVITSRTVFKAKNDFLS